MATEGEDAEDFSLESPSIPGMEDFESTAEESPSPSIPVATGSTGLNKMRNLFSGKKMGLASQKEKAKGEVLLTAAKEISDKKGIDCKWMKAATEGGAVEGSEKYGYFTRQKMAEKMKLKMEKIEACKAKLKAAAYGRGGLDWKKMFEKYDADGSGEIDYEEFRIAIRKDAKITVETLPEDSLKTLFRFIDKDSGGSIHYEEEFIPWMTAETPKHIKRASKKRNKEALEARKDEVAAKDESRLEKKKQLKLKEQEFIIDQARRGLRAASYAKGGVNWKKLFQTYDRDNSGEICYDEFRRAIRKGAKITIDTFSEKQMRTLFEYLDVDKGNTISYVDEFLPFVMGGDDGSASDAQAMSSGKSGSESDIGRQVRDDPLSSRDVDLSKQISQLSSLVKSQSKMIKRMQVDHQGELSRVQHEQNALISVLNSSGTVPASSLELELQQSATKRPRSSPASPGSPAELTSRTSSPSRSSKKQTSSPMPGSSPSSPFWLDPDAEEEDLDLFELCQPLLHRSSVRKDYDKAMKKVGDALSRGAKADVWRGPGTPLLGAVEAGNTELAVLLMNAGASVNVRNEQGVSALHIASFHGAMDTAIMLLDFRADPNMPDCYDQTPMFFTPIRQICELLFQRLADPATLNCVGQSALHLAAKAGYGDVILWFSHHLPRALIELKDRDGFNAMKYAQSAQVAPHVVKKMRNWEPTLKDKEFENISTHKGATDLEMGECDDGGETISNTMQNQIRLKLRAAAYWRGGVDWEEMFNRFDGEGNGELNFREFYDAMREGANVSVSMMSDNGLKGLFRMMDTDGGGTINYRDEFMAWLEPVQEEVDEEEAIEDGPQKELLLKPQVVEDIRKRLRAAAYSNGVLNWSGLFKYFDKDNSGEINFLEFKAAMRKSAKITLKQCPDTTLKILFDFLDTSGDGTVEYETEFLKWVDPGGTGEENIGAKRQENQIDKLKKKEDKAKFEAAVDLAQKALKVNSMDNGQVNLKKVWRIYDKKEEGLITFEDFLQMLRRQAKVKPQSLSDAGIMLLFRALELQDGKLKYEEGFLKWLKVDPGDDEPAESTFSVAAAQRIRVKKARKEILDRMRDIKERLTTACYDHGVVNFKKFFNTYDKDNSGEMDFEEFSLLIRKKCRMSPQFLSDDCVRSLFEYVAHEEKNEFIISYEADFLPWLGVELGKDAGMTEDQKAAKRAAAEKSKLKSAKKEMSANMYMIFTKLKACAYDNKIGGANWEKVFRTYDKDNSGEIDMEEFKAIIRKQARVKVQEVSDEALTALFNSVDQDGGGTVNYYEEFLPFLEERQQKVEESDVAKSNTKQQARDAGGVAAIRSDKSNKKSVWAPMGGPSSVKSSK